MFQGSSFKQAIKEACTLPGVSLFLVPLIYFPFLQSSFTQGKELSFKLLLLGAFCFLLAYALKKSKLHVRTIGDSALFTFLLAQLVLHAFSNFLSDTPLVSMYGTFSRGGGFIFELYLFGFLLWNAFFLSQERLQKVLKLLWLSASLVALYAGLQKLGADFLFQNYATNLFQGRVFSSLGNPSLLGQFMSLSTVLSFYLFIQEKQKSRKVIFALSGLWMLTVLLLSGTRAAVLGLLGLGALLAIKYHKQIWQLLRKNLWKVTLLIPLFALVLLFTPAGRFDLSSLSLRSLYSRFEIWKGTADLVEEHWVLGYGQETFYIHFPEVVTKEFLTLEEDVNISADRVHNEWLQEIYDHGIFAGLLYLVLLVVLFKKFFTSNRAEEILLSALLLTNSFQNQLSFPDPTLQVLVAFTWGALIALESRETTLQWFWPKRKQVLAACVGGLLIVVLVFQTVARPFAAHFYYTKAQHNTEYETVITAMKSALTWAPYYSELWYELMFLDPSSMERALQNLEVIDGESGDVLAWKGNFYAESDPQLAAQYFLDALEKNPYHPNWLRAFGDMLYANGDCETALYIYQQYIEAVPDYWKWTLDLESYTEAQQKSYETFFKHAPYFFGTLEKMEACSNRLGGSTSD
jgi:O-antigen ligase